MIHFWPLTCLLFVIVTIVTSENAELRTRQGIIYGRQTQSSVEYLGYTGVILNCMTFFLIAFQDSIRESNSMETTD